MNKNLWLDCDGVLLDWVNPFLAFTGMDSIKGYQELDDYYFVQDHFGEQAAAKVLEFSNSAEFRHLPALLDPTELRLLKNTRGYKLRVITQLDAPTQAKDNRIANLVDRFGDIFESIDFTKHGQSKLAFIRGHSPDDYNIIVEDNPVLLHEINGLKYPYVEADSTMKSLEVYAVLHPYNHRELIKVMPNVSIHGTTQDALTTILNKDYTLYD